MIRSLLLPALALLLLWGCPNGGGAGGTTPDASPDVGNGDADSVNTVDTADALDTVDVTVETGFPRLEFVHIDTGTDAPIEATDFHFIPGSDEEILVLEKDGFVSQYTLAGDTASRVTRTSIPGIYSHLDCGLLSLAFDPDFETNHLLYLGYCGSLSHNVIVRATWDLDAQGELTTEPVEIIQAGDPDSEFPWHNVGSMGFDEAGVLWTIWGDQRISQNAQDAGNVLGGLSRIIPSREAGVGGYEPAPDNPYVGQDSGHPALWAWGFRAPWRGALDRHGRYWIADVGENDWEELNLATVPGQNFGWPFHEGTCTSNCTGFVDPITQYNHEDTEPYVLDDEDAEPIISRAIWVSPELRAVEGDPYGGRLDEHVLVGDFCAGFMRAMQADESDTLVVDEQVAHLANVTQVEQRSDGTLFLSVYGACKTKTPEDPPGGLYRAVMAGE